MPILIVTGENGDELDAEVMQEVVEALTRLLASAEGKDVLFIDDDPLVEMEAGGVAWGAN